MAIINPSIKPMTPTMAPTANVARPILPQMPVTTTMKPPSPVMAAPSSFAQAYLNQQPIQQQPIQQQPIQQQPIQQQPIQQQPVQQQAAGNIAPATTQPVPVLPQQAVQNQQASTGNMAPATTQPVPYQPVQQPPLPQQQTPPAQVSQPQPMQQPAPAQQGLEQQALGGGSNPQQVQNFLTALNQSNATASNNAMQNAPANNPSEAQATPLYNPSAPGASLANTAQQAPQGSLVQNTPQLQGTVAGSSYNAQPVRGQNTNQMPVGSPAQTPTTTQTPAATQPPVLNAPSQQRGGPSGPQLVSDENAKENIQDGDRTAKDFLNSLGAHSYEYKDKADGVGTFISPMAQELEKTAVGKSAVKEDATGKKMVDYGRLSGIMLAAQATMNQRLNDIEKNFKMKDKK